MRYPRDYNRCDSTEGRERVDDHLQHWRHFRLRRRYVLLEESQLLLSVFTVPFTRASFSSLVCAQAGCCTRIRWTRCSPRTSGKTPSSSRSSSTASLKLSSCRRALSSSACVPAAQVRTPSTSAVPHTPLRLVLVPHQDVHQYCPHSRFVPLPPIPFYCTRSLVLSLHPTRLRARCLFRYFRSFTRSKRRALLFSSHPLVLTHLASLFPLRLCTRKLNMAAFQCSVRRISAYRLH